MKKPPEVLKTLLWVNELRETKAREEFQRAKRALSELKEMLAEVSARPKRLYDELGQEPVSGAELRLFAQQIDRLLEEKEKAEKIMRSKEKEVERLRQEAVRLHQRRRMAETLWEKARTYYLRERQKEEFKNMEDLLLMRRNQDENL